MTFVQQLLVAPAALGLLATGVNNAAELNINGVSDYAASADQVTSVTQFSDVYPTDWAYQALAGLVETYGCVAGYPNGTFRGNRAMTRYEAAALLNACLDRVTEVTDELRRLMAEFETELAILKGRVDGLEAKVGELEATQFSTTTKLSGVATFVAGANRFMGSADQLRSTNNRDSGGTVFNYDLQLALGDLVFRQRSIEHGFTRWQLWCFQCVRQWRPIRTGCFGECVIKLKEGRMFLQSTSCSIPSPLASPSPSPRGRWLGRKTCWRCGPALTPVIQSWMC